MNSSLLIAQDIFKFMAFLLIAFVFVKNIRSELE